MATLSATFRRRYVFTQDVDLSHTLPVWGKTGSRDVSLNFLTSQFDLQQALINPTEFEKCPILESDVLCILCSSVSDLKEALLAS